MPRSIAIADIQGCYDALQTLLKAIDYQPNDDTLIIVGDLINRGKQNVAVLQFLMQCPKIHVILGNHDLYAMGVYANLCAINKHDTFSDVLSHPEAKTFIHWLSQQHLYYQDNTYVATHAGIYPFWSIEQNIELIKNAQQQLKQSTHQFLHTIFTQQASTPEDNPIAFITNVITRMRYCTPEGALNFNEKRPPHQQQAQRLKPWFDYINWSHPHMPAIFFGHWSSLKAQHIHPKCYALDGGYCWGGKLIAFDLSSRQKWSVSA